MWQFLNCSDSVAVLDLFRQCGSFRIVQTVWRYLQLIRLRFDQNLPKTYIHSRNIPDIILVEIYINKIKNKNCHTDRMVVEFTATYAISA
jgi:hypothetical protein